MSAMLRLNNKGLDYISDIIRNNSLLFPSRRVIWHFADKIESSAEIGYSNTMELSKLESKSGNTESFTVPDVCFDIIEIED